MLMDQVMNRVVAPPEPPDFPLVTSLDSSRVCYAAIRIDNMRQGKKSISELDGTLEDVAGWLEGSAEEIAASGIKEVSRFHPLAYVLKMAFVKAKIMRETSSVARVIVNAKMLSRRIEKALENVDGPIDEAELAYLGRFCSELYQALSAHERGVVKQY
jgi:hypothetical protein